MARAVALCLLVLVWASNVEAEHLKYLDPKQPLGARIADLLKRMTLEEKVGQMTQIERNVATPQILKDYFIGLQGEIPANQAKGVPYVAGSRKVAACAKHFVGDGGTHEGIDENNTLIDSRGLFSIHMPAYYNSIIKGVSTVMVSYSSWNGKKMHDNRELITGFLKNTLKFRGFVISDWQGIDRITSPPGANYTFSVEASVNAGIDMVMVPNDYISFISILTDLVKKNFVPMSRIDDAVKRILRVKFAMGLFENPYGDLGLVDQLGMKKAPRILVAGIHADDIGLQCGGWTIEWQGQPGNITSGTTILEAIKSAVDSGTEVIYSQFPSVSFVEENDFSYSIVVVGEPPYAELAGDNLNLTIPEPGPSIISNVCGSSKCAVIIISGRPLVVAPYLPAIDALVAAWLPGSEGGGVADVLFGDHGFTGKLPRTWFKSVDQLPMNVGDAHYDPLFPFGFGLTTNATKA
ncbi:Beta-xylosidase/alpha-L-arabinofuranosidase 2 [Platanthera zijinensis]|uniref:beta-glucosidase n=1 Tax=Platanthera zijinensis TaxID=2320716 RepID=A0AAP0C163_9ASPA